MVTLLGTLFTMNGTIIADAYYDGKVHQVIIKDIDHHKLKVSESQNAAYEFLQFCEES